ncbi:hypothetical protein DV737_g4257, partial [Chaetothyriales sp. CBS 132003]
MSPSPQLAAPGSSTYNSRTMHVGDGTWDAGRDTFLLPNLVGLNFATMRYNGMGNRFFTMSGYQSLVKAHGILAAITFLGAVPLSIFIIRFYGRRKTLASKLHVWLNILALLLTTVVFILGFVAVGPKRSLTNPHHVALGLTLYGSPLYLFLLYALYLFGLLVVWFILTWLVERRKAEFEGSEGSYFSDEPASTRPPGSQKRHSRLGPMAMAGAAGLGAAALWNRHKSKSKRTTRIDASESGTGTATSYMSDEKYSYHDAPRKGWGHRLLEVGAVAGGVAAVKKLFGRRDTASDSRPYRPALGGNQSVVDSASFSRIEEGQPPVRPTTPTGNSPGYHRPSHPLAQPPITPDRASGDSYSYYSYMSGSPSRQDRRGNTFRNALAAGGTAFAFRQMLKNRRQKKEEQRAEKLRVERLEEERIQRMNSVHKYTGDGTAPPPRRHRPDRLGSQTASDVSAIVSEHAGVPIVGAVGAAGVAAAAAGALADRDRIRPVGTDPAIDKKRLLNGGASDTRQGGAILVSAAAVAETDYLAQAETGGVGEGRKASKRHKRHTGQSLYPTPPPPGTQHVDPRIAYNVPPPPPIPGSTSHIGPAGSITSPGTETSAASDPPATADPDMLAADNNSVAQSTPPFPPRLAARFYRHTSSRRRSSAHSSRRSSLSSISLHSHHSNVSCHGGPRSTHVAQHLRRASIIESRKKRLADRAAHAEQVRLRAAAAKNTPRVSHSEERALAAQAAREKLLAEIAARCEEEVRRAKKIAEETREKKAAERARMQEQLADKFADAARRRSIYQSSMRRSRTTSLAAVEEKKISPAALPKIGRTAAAKVIQRAWRKYSARKICLSFKALDLDLTQLASKSFEEITRLLAEERAIKATAGLLKHLGMIDAVQEAGADRVAVRIFLSGYLILAHPMQALSYGGGQENEQELMAKAKALIEPFEIHVQSILQDALSGTAAKTAREELGFSFNEFTSAFHAWKNQDRTLLIDVIVNSFVNLDLIIQSTKDDRRGMVAEDYLQAVRSEQVKLLARLKRLAGPEQALARVRAASIQHRAGSAPQSFIARLGQTMTVLPPNREIAHEMQINGSFEVQQQPWSEARNQFIDVLRTSMRDSMQDGGVQVAASWTHSMTVLIREKLLNLVSPRHQLYDRIDQVLDPKLIEQQSRHGMFSYHDFFNTIASIIAQICSPGRDEAVQAFATDTESDTIDRLFNLMNIIDLMTLDHINFQFRLASRQVIEHGHQHERKMFEQDLRDGVHDLRHAKTWWRIARQSGPAAHPTGQAVYARGLTDLALQNSHFSYDQMPETLQMDYIRLLKLRAHAFHMVAVSSILLTTKLRLQRNRQSLWTNDAERLMSLDLTNTSAQRVVSLIESSHQMPSTTRQGLLDFVTRVLPAAAAATSNAANTDQDRQAAIQEERPFDPSSLADDGVSKDDVFHEQIATFVLKSLREHVFQRLSAASTAEKVRVTTSAAQVLARAGMPEFVSHVGDMVDLLERIRNVDLKAHEQCLAVNQTYTLQASFTPAHLSRALTPTPSPPTPTPAIPFPPSEDAPPPPPPAPPPTNPTPHPSPTSPTTRPGLPATTLPLAHTELAGKTVPSSTFTPIAKFPGPKLAAATLWYEFYFDVILGGQFGKHIAALHDQYGKCFRPIVRISPYELHVKDPDYYDVLYSGAGSKRDKYAWHARLFGNSGSMFSTVPHDLHRLRRSCLNPFFSKQAVVRLEPLLTDMINKFSARLEGFRDTGKPFEAGQAYAALTTDIITKYAFSTSYGCIEDPDWKYGWPKAMIDGTKSCHLSKQYGFIFPMMQATPEFIVKRVAPGKEIVDVVDGRADEEKSHKTLFQELLNNDDLPPEEKSLQRLVDEGQTLISAGQHTTAHHLKTVSYYILANPDVLQKLKAELEVAIPDPAVIPPLHQLEGLPYLRGVVLEGHRLSHGVASRLPRISPDQPLQFNEWVIPAGTPVSMTSVIQHLDATKFPEPEKFDPDRWINGPKGQEKYVVSFNRGTRQCLGMNLANAELYMTIATVFRRFNLELHETGARDVEIACEYFIAHPHEDSKGHVLYEELQKLQKLQKLRHLHNEIIRVFASMRAQMHEDEMPIHIDADPPEDEQLDDEQLDDEQLNRPVLKDITELNSPPITDGSNETDGSTETRMQPVENAKSGNQGTAAQDSGSEESRDATGSESEQDLPAVEGSNQQDEPEAATESTDIAREEKAEGDDSFVDSIKSRSPTKLRRESAQADSFVEDITSRTPIRPKSRIEDSVDAIDALEDAIEQVSGRLPKLDHLNLESPVKSTPKRADKRVLTPVHGQTQTKNVTPLVRKTPLDTKRLSRTPQDAKRLSKTPLDAKRPSKTSLDTKRPSKTSLDTNPLSKTPASAKKPLLKSPPKQSQVTPARAQAGRLSTVKPVKRASIVPKSPSKPTTAMLQLAPKTKTAPAREARPQMSFSNSPLKQQQPTNTKKRATSGPLSTHRPGFVPASVAPRENRASHARISAIRSGSNKENVTPRHVPAVVSNPATSVTVTKTRPGANKANSSVRRTTLPPKATTTEARASLAPRVASLTAGQKLTVTKGNTAQQKAKGKEVFGRVKVEKEAAEKERREKEEATKKARAEAAERGRQASREWAEKQKRKMEAVKAARAAGGTEVRSAARAPAT